MTKGEVAEDRVVLAVGGSDAHEFLKGLVTRDAEAGRLIYSALLTAQGKFLFDFFLLDQGDRILVDVASDRAQALAQRLSLYRLRANVTVEATDLVVLRGLGDAPEEGQPDPRHAALGWRAYVAHVNADPVPAQTDWTALRVAHAIPEAGPELTADDSYILEWGFDRLGGVDHRKGCYVGQEVTARMKHKTELRKGLRVVNVEGDATPGTPIEAGGKVVGTLHSRSGQTALAYLRFDRMTAEMTAGDAKVRLADTDQT